MQRSRTPRRRFTGNPATVSISTIWKTRFLLLLIYSNPWGVLGRKGARPTGARHVRFCGGPPLSSAKTPNQQTTFFDIFSLHPLPSYRRDALPPRLVLQAGRGLLHWRDAVVLPKRMIYRSQHESRNRIHTPSLTSSSTQGDIFEGRHHSPVAFSLICQLSLNIVGALSPPPCHTRGCRTPLTTWIRASGGAFFHSKETTTRSSSSTEEAFRMAFRRAHLRS